ncbi:uncharacterized protein BcabD6B2_33570 [Babesia caballi]|uniref:Uncharacterized protein n=1 Tax=Babesia caballi TaxID=5871 RepID=A0AAV4LUK0_BABCB|nr:hypothetical protein, conserved [Babesia caballi]
MLQSAPRVELQPSSPPHGSAAPNAGPVNRSGSKGAAALVSDEAAEETVVLVLPHSVHVAEPGHAKGSQQSMSDSDSPLSPASLYWDNASSADEDPPLPGGDRVYTGADVAYDASGEEVLDGRDCKSDDSRGDAAYNADLSQLILLPSRSIGDGVTVDVSPRSNSSTASGGNTLQSYGIRKIEPMVCRMTCEEALKMLSECGGSKSTTPTAKAPERRRPTPPTRSARTPASDTSRSSTKSKTELDVELLKFLQSQESSSAKEPPSPSVEETSPRQQQEQLPCDDNTDPVSPVAASAPTLPEAEAEAPKPQPVHPAVPTPPNYSDYFQEDSEALSQLRAVFTPEDQHAEEGGTPTRASCALPADPLEAGLHPLFPVVDWLPEEPPQETDPAEEDQDAISLFNGVDALSPYDQYGEPFFVSEGPDGPDDINAKMRLLRHVHESLYTSSEMASLSTIEKFILELLQPDNDFGTLNAYGRLLAFVNLSALRRHMSQLAALYLHPEMAVVRHVMRFNEEGSIQKMLHISESVASGHMTDKAGSAAILDLVARMDRKDVSHYDKGYGSEQATPAEGASRGGGAGHSQVDLKSNRQLLALLDDLACLYRPGGEAHFPRFVCGSIDRKNVDAVETLSIPFDKADRRNVHVQFERLGGPPDADWPASTYIPQVVAEGLRVQVAPLKQQASSCWSLGTVTSVSSGVLMVAVDSAGAKDAGRATTSDRMYMMRNFIPPNVPSMRVEKAQWRILPRQVDLDRDIYVGSCLSVFDPAVGGFIDRVVVNVLFGEGDECCIAPVKSPKDESLFEVSAPAEGYGAQPNGCSESHGDRGEVAGLHASTKSAGSVPEGLCALNRGGHDDSTRNRKFQGAGGAFDKIYGTKDGVLGNAAVSTGPRGRVPVNAHAMGNGNPKVAASATVWDGETCAKRAGVELIPTCHCKGHTLRMFEGRAATNYAGRPRRVILSALNDRRDVTIEVDKLRAYKLNYDLQSHFDCLPDPVSAGAQPSTGWPATYFQHCVWVVPRYLSFREAMPDPASLSRVGSHWFFEPERCLLLFPYNKSVDLLQEAPRLVSFLHPELNYTALCAGIWNVRASGHGPGDAQQAAVGKAPAAEPPQSRAEPLSLTRSQKAATRELTATDIVNEACMGVVRCHSSLVRRLFGCTSVISLWMTLDGLDLNDADASQLTLTIRIPEKPHCARCGGAVYARSDVTKTLPAARPIRVPPAAGGSAVVATLPRLLKNAATGISALSGTEDAAGKPIDAAVEGLMDILLGATKEGMQGTSVASRTDQGRVGAATGAGSSSNSVRNEDQNRLGYTREQLVFSDLEATEEVIRRLHLLATSRWRVTREFIAAYSTDEDVVLATVRAQQHAPSSPAARHFNGRSEFIHKLAEFLSSVRHSNTVRIDGDLYRGAYSSSSELFNPRSIEAVLLRGWAAFIIGQNKARTMQQAQPQVRRYVAEKPQRPGFARRPSAPGPQAHAQAPGADVQRGQAAGKADRSATAHSSSHVPAGEVETAQGARGGQLRRSREEKRPKPSRGESPRDGGAVRGAAEPEKKPRRGPRSLLARMADAEYCEFKDKEVRFKYVSVVKWDEDLEPSAVVSGAQ